MTATFQAADPKYKWLESRGDGWQFGEQGIIDAIIERIGEGSRECFEIGAGDGDRLPVTCERLMKRGWDTTLWESDPIKRDSLWMLFGDGTGERFHVLGEYTPEVIPDYDDGVVVIDVDGMDYYLLRSIMLSGSRPNLILCEHADKRGEGSDELFIPTIEQATIPPVKQATERAIVGLATGCGYVHIGSTRVNSFFVRDDLVEKRG